MALNAQEVEGVMSNIVNKAGAVLRSRRNVVPSYGLGIERGRVNVSEEACQELEQAIKLLIEAAEQERDERKARVVPGIMVDGSAPLLSEFCPALPPETSAVPDPHAWFATLEFGD